MNGATAITAPPISTPYSRTRPGEGACQRTADLVLAAASVGRSAAGSQRSSGNALVIDDPLAGEVVLQQREAQNHREEQERDRRAVAVAVGLVELLEDQNAGRGGSVARPA